MATPAPSSGSSVQLVWPDRAHLPGYVRALERGWSPNNMNPEAGREELVQIEADADAFLASLDSRVERGAPIKLPDGSLVPRLPGYRRWIWLGHDFCGSIGFRWQDNNGGKEGNNDLPPYCLGHIGYAVVPWQRQRGCATHALALLLQEAPATGLRFVEITTQPDNLASQKVIRANRGVLVEEFITEPALGGLPELRFRIELGVVQQGKEVQHPSRVIEKWN